MFNLFGSTVKIKITDETVQKELAGKTGMIYGFTIPSLSKVEVIRNSNDDVALSVLFEDLNTAYWFTENLLEFIDDGQGIVMTIGDKKWTKRENGEWLEEETGSASTKRKKKWWQFWK